jgi:tetratricopeptide (TPR) repeat protein
VGRVETQYRAFTALQVDETASNRFTEGGGYRYDLWRIAWREFGDHPVGGLGAGNYAAQYFTHRRNPQYVRQPHSLELQTLAELGLAGGIALLTLVGGVAWGIARAARRSPPDGPPAAIVVAAAGGTTAWFVHTSVDWLHNLPSVTAVALVLAGLALAATREEDAAAVAGSRAAPLGRALAVGLIALTAVAAASVGRQFVADRYRHHAQSLVATDPAEAVRVADRSLAFNPSAPEPYYARAAALARTDDYASARETLMVAAAKEPFNYVPWALLGDLAVRRGDLRQAGRDYGRASALNPFDPGLRDLAADPARAAG